MEISLWAAIAIGVFFAEVLGMETTRVLCAALIAVLTVTWLLHGVFLLRPPVVFSLSTVAGIGLVGYLVLAKWDELGNHGIVVLICLPVFLAIPGVFTGRQICRFLAFLCFAGGAQVFYCIVSPTLVGQKASFFEGLGEGNRISGTLNSEAELTAFLSCSVCAAAAFALRALTGLARERSVFSTGGVISRLASPGANLALLSTLCAVLGLVPLFLCGSLFPFPTVVLAGIALVGLLGANRLVSAFPAALVIVVLLMSGVVNLALPAWGGQEASEIGETSDSALTANLENLSAGIDWRSGIHDNPSSDTEMSMPLIEDNCWTATLRKGDWGEAWTRYGQTSFVLLVVFGALILAEGFRALVLYREAQPALLAGAIGGFLALLLTGLWGSFLANPGLALLASAFCAMTAAGGEYDEEFEEIEIVPADPRDLSERPE